MTDEEIIQELRNGIDLGNLKLRSNTSHFYKTIFIMREIGMSNFLICNTPHKEWEPTFYLDGYSTYRLKENYNSTNNEYEKFKVIIKDERMIIDTCSPIFITDAESYIDFHQFVNEDGYEFSYLKKVTDAVKTGHKVFAMFKKTKDSLTRQKPFIKNETNKFKILDI